jgi:serine/threonine protein phosphatase PrpC
MLLLKMETPCVAGAGRTHSGGRADNQDVLVVEPSLGLYGVLDGMGGYAGGEIAAQIGGETLVDFIRRHRSTKRFTPCDLVESAINAASAEVHAASKVRPKCESMGTTVAACLVVDPTCVVIGHAGDSRVYLSRGGRLRLLTRDHTLAQELIDKGQMSPELAETMHYQHVLTRNLGLEESAQAELLEMSLHVGDRLLLSSDGLHGCVAPETIQHVLVSSAAPEPAAHSLIELALSSDQLSDNVSAVVLVARSTAEGGGTRCA